MSKRDVLLETLIDQLLEEYEDQYKKGKNCVMAFNDLCESYSLNHKEKDTFRIKIQENSDRFKKYARASLINKNSLPEHKIIFKNEDEREKAAQKLMFNKVPWKSKGCDESGCHHIEFDHQQNLEDGLDALDRHWDFSDNQHHQVAKIEFDNLDDYQKVIEFMHKSGMLLDFSGNAELENVVVDEEDDETQTPPLSCLKAHNRKTRRECVLNAHRDENQRCCTVRKCHR